MNFTIPTDILLLIYKFHVLTNTPEPEFYINLAYMLKCITPPGFDVWPLVETIVHCYMKKYYIDHPTPDLITTYKFKYYREYQRVRKVVIHKPFYFKKHMKFIEEQFIVIIYPGELYIIWSTQYEALALNSIISRGRIIKFDYTDSCEIPKNIPREMIAEFVLNVSDNINKNFKLVELCISPGSLHILFKKWIETH